MYVCTVRVSDLNWMIRVECFHTLAGAFATYRRTDEHGEEESYSCPIGPDQHGIGLPTVAIIDLVRDLDWTDAMSVLHVVHAGALNADEVHSIMVQMAPAYQIRDMTTTRSAH